MSLRLRLILTFLAVVFLLGVGNLVTFYINRGIQRDVSSLSRSSAVDLAEDVPSGHALEIEGDWREQLGGFVAEDIEKLPTSRRPKLRGEIQVVDHGTGVITLYGVPVAVTDKTVFLDEPAGGRPRLWAGRRVEVSCNVDSIGRWTARKIKTQGVKRSDKVKGVITRAAIDGTPPDTLELSGLTILLVGGTEGSNPRSHLNRLEKAIQMMLAIQTCRTAARDLLREMNRERRHSREGDTEAAEKARTLASDAALELRQGHDDFAHYLQESRLSAREAVRLAGEEGADDVIANENTEVALWLDPLSRAEVTLESNVARLLELANTDLDGAHRFLQEVLDPEIQNEVLPLVHAYQFDAEESLSKEVQAISARAGTTTRLGIIANLAALVAALLLGLAVSRYISRPILALKAAALRIGHGHLDTRVDVHTKDELGVLAATFNQMAEDLAETTVSRSNLANVLDSMAGALIILSPAGEIMSVNQAVRTLLGYEKGDLLGQPFTLVCPPAGKEREELVATDERGMVVNEEKEFRAKDGASIPVSFSGAALRSEGGPVQGYVCVAQDLTERKRIEEQIRQSLSEKELLLHELHHRVKNNLQVISSLLDLQSSFIDDPKTLENFRESQSRIRSMALIHEQLYHTTELDEIDFKTYLERLTAHLFDSFGVRTDVIALRLDVEDLGLNLDQAVACGLIVNELVTNALKHAFPKNTAGEIVIGYRRGEDGGRVLSVCDDGRGIDEQYDPDQSDSLGMSLVETLVKQLRGRLTFSHDGGTQCRIEFSSGTVGQGAVT
ncbi:MAG: histidine kinase dimerization/phosphoacceptor domain -containing protein [Candidatus Krumholzibacteriia bacterium]